MKILILLQKLFHPIVFFKVIAVLKSLQLCMILSPTQPKSLCINRAVSYFCETEIHIWASQAVQRLSICVLFLNVLSGFFQINKTDKKDVLSNKGGFQLPDLIIRELKSHMNFQKFKDSHWWKFYLSKKNALQDLLSNLNAVISTNERH